MRIRIPDLAPGVNYAFRLRSNTGTAVSEWSRVFYVTAASDLIAPSVPAGVAGSMSGTSFNLTWNVVTTSADGSAAFDLDHYEVKVESTGTATTANYLSNDNKFELTLEKNRNLFGSPRANIKMSVRAVDKVGNASAFSTVIDQTNAAPANPTGFTGVASTDTLNFKWTAVADADLMTYRIYSGTTSGSQTTLAWSGLATNATVQSTDYSTDRWYKVVAVDVFGTESPSGPVVGPIKPSSPFTVDVTAPPVPTGLTATLTTAADTTTSAQASWTAVTDTDGDLAGYRIGYRPVGATDWSYTDVDYTLTSTRIDRLTPYVNYEFRIRAYDWSANFSAWSATFTTNTAASNTAPAASSGVTASAAYGTVIVSWTEATENDVKFGAGMYDVQLDTSTAFNTANLRTLRTSATVASFNNVAAGTWYTRVRAVDSLGVAGAWSGNVTVVQNDTVATNAYIASRGTDLVTNGTGLLGNNYNFSTFTFDKVDAPAGTGGSFKSPATMGTLFTDEFIPLDPSKRYKFSLMAKQTGTATTAYAYTGFAPYDINKFSIAPMNYMYQNNTTTTLAADLKPGDTVIYLTSAANWNNAAGTSTHLRGIIVWNYVDPVNGKDWGERSYSRDAKLNIYADGAVDTTANTVTLSAPWVGFTNTGNGESGRTTIPAGTPISNSSSGSGYMYLGLSNTNIPQAWTAYSGLINGFMPYGTSLTSQSAAIDKFPPGTAFAKLLFLTNRSTTGGGAYATGSFHSFAALSLSDASYAQTTAEAAVKTSVNEYSVNSSETVAPTTGWSTTQPARTPGTFVWFRTTVTRGDGTTSTTSPALLTGNTGATGAPGTPASNIVLTATTQVLTSPSGGGATNPTTSTVTGTAVNTTITVWEYSVDGAAYSATVPAGVSRTGNVVTITGSTMTARTITVRMADAAGIADTMTVAKVIDGATGSTGGTGPAGADAYTVLLTNEAQTFAAGTTNALAGSATTTVMAYKGNVQQTATVGTITGGATGITAAVTNNGTTAPLITFTVTTALTTANGTFTIPVTVGGITFNQIFSWSLAFTGSQGTAGTPGAPAANIDLTATTQVLASPSGGGATTPATSTVTGTATNTTITVWEYSVDGGAFSATVPTGASRTGNVVTITGSTMTARTITVRMADANGIADTLTVAKTFDGATGGTGGTGLAGADAYTVILSNEAQVFPGSTNAALAGSATTSVIAYKAAVQQTATIGTITGQVTGLTTAITNNGTTSPTVTVTVTTALVTQSGTLTIPVTVGGITFTKLFAWSVSYTGATGSTGGTGPTGLGITSVTPYFNQTTAGAAAPAKPTASPPPAPWVANEPDYVSNTDLWRTERVIYTDASFSYTNVSKVSSYTAAVTAITTANGKNKVTYSQSAPGTTPNTVGDVWFQLGDGVSVSSGQIIAQYSGGGGTSWFAKTLNNQVISTLDAGKITTGTLDVANRIAAGSIDAAKIVGDSITGNQIAANTISSAEMIAGTITAASGIIADAAIVNAKIANVSADKLIANTSFINDLNVKSKFTLGDAATDGNIESYDYGTSSGTTGFKLAKSGLIIKTGAIEAAALKIQAGANMIPAEYSSFEFVPTFYLTRLPTTGATVSKTTVTSGGKVGPQYLQARSTSAASFILYLGLTTTDYNIYVDAGVTYIVSAWVKTGTVASSVSLKAYYDNATNSGNVGTTALSASGAWQRISGVVTIPAGVGKMLLAVDVSTATSGAGFDIDGIQVEQKIGSINTPSTWTMPGSTSVDGGIIRTGEIRSTSNVVVNGVQQPAWSVNMSGNAQFGDAAVRGKLVVGTGTMVNLVPGNGTFESGSAMNWFVYDGTATGTAINLTTVPGEVIAGTYSGKSIASPVANNELGLYFDVADIPPGATVHLTGTVKGDYPGTHIRVGIGDLSTGTFQFITEDVYKYMLADTAVTFDRTFTMPVGYTGKRIFIYLVNGMTSTFIIDNVSAYVDSELSGSYAASGNFQQGVQGWKIDSSGNAEFNNGTFRGTLSASTLIGDNVVGGRVISGPINGTHAEMTSAGFKAFVEDPLDGVPNEVVRIGTEGNDTIGISDAAGNTLASIDETGRGLFKAISVGQDAPIWTTDPVDGSTYLSSGLEIYGKEFNQYINGLSRGVVSSGYLGSAWAPPALNTQGEVGIGEISFVQEGETADTLRSYRVVFNGAMGSATTSRIGVIYRLRYTNTGASPAVVTSTIADSVITQIDTVGEAVAIPPMIVQSAWTTTPGAVIRVLLTAQRYYGTGSWNINTYAGGGTFKPLRLYVEDVGLDVPDTWITNYGGNDFSGGAPAAPTVKKTYTATWSSTAGYTYRGDGVRRTDTSDIVQGYSSYATINGNGKGLWLFPTSIATTLSGATVNKVEVYAYANHWYANAGGTAMIKVHGYTTMPASSPTLTAATSSAGWPKPGGRWVTLPSSFNAGFQNGTYRGFGMGPGTSTSSTYYGRFNGGTAAKIRITYTK